MKKLIVFLMATLIFNITTAQEIKWDKKKGGYSVGGKKIAQLTKIKRGFGNFKGFELRNMNDEVILTTDGDVLEDTLGMYFVRIYEIVSFPKMNKRATMLLSEIKVKGNRYKTVGYGLLKENLLNEDGTLNSEGVDGFIKKYHKNFEEQLKKRNEEITSTFAKETKIIARNMRSREIDADRYGNCGQDNKVIGKWTYEEIFEGQGVNKKAKYGMCTFRNLDGKVVAWTLKDFMGLKLYYLKDGKLEMVKNPKNVIAAKYDVDFKTPAERARKNRNHATLALQYLIKAGVI